MFDPVDERNYLKCWYCQNDENDKKNPPSNPANAPNCRKPDKLKNAYENDAKQAKRMVELGKQSKEFEINNLIPNVSIEVLTEMMLFNKAVWNPNCLSQQTEGRASRG